MKHAKSKTTQASSNSKFTSGAQNSQRHPKPPSIPRSHSSKELQQACKNNPNARAGRKILFRSHSSPNIGSTGDLNLPKHHSTSCTTGKSGIFYGFRGQQNVVEEFPPVAGKQKTSLTAKEDALITKTELFSKNIETIKDTTTELRGLQSVDKVSHGRVEQERKNLTSTKRHSVFFIDHDDGRLLSRLLPVPEEPEQDPHDKSPWQCHGNESNISDMDGRFYSNEEPGLTYDKSPWHCYDNRSRRYHVVDELFESDEEGLVIKEREMLENRMDPIKKAMIDSWILDVTLKTSKFNKKVTY